MYEGFATNATGQAICGMGGASCSSTDAGEPRYGGYFFAFSSGSGLVQSSGTWAVTAP
jgi:hypothetical protein